MVICTSCWSVVSTIRSGVSWDKGRTRRGGPFFVVRASTPYGRRVCCVLSSRRAKVRNGAGTPRRMRIPGQKMAKSKVQAQGRCRFEPVLDPAPGQVSKDGRRAEHCEETVTKGSLRGQIVRMPIGSKP